MKLQMPCILYYAKRGLNDSIDMAVQVPMSVYRHRLLHDRSISQVPRFLNEDISFLLIEDISCTRSSGVKCVPLQENEELPPGCLVALDAEFVSLRHEEVWEVLGGYDYMLTFALRRSFAATGRKPH